MCLFRSAAPTPQPTPPPIIAKKNLQEQSTLPQKKELLDPEEKAEVEYGTTAKAGQAAAQKTGTDALKINLNTGSGGAGAGGINV